MSYAITAIEAEQSGAKQLGVNGGGKLNEATGIATFTNSPTPTTAQATSKTAAKTNPVAQKYIAKRDPRDIGVQSWIRANRATSRRPGRYRQALAPHHEATPRPVARRNRGYDLLKTMQQVMQPQPQKKPEAPKEITLAIKQLPYKPVRQIAKIALAANGYNFG